MKIIKRLLLIAVVLIVLWIDLPEKFRIESVSKIIKRDFKTHLGLDLQGGSHLVFQADISKTKPEDLTEALNSARDTIERRVNFFGVSEASIQTLKSGGTYRIAVDLPGVTDVAQAVNLIGRTAQLSFREQEASISAKEATSTPLIILLRKDTGLTGADVKKATVEFSQENGEPQVALSFSKKGTELFAQITERNVGKPVGIFLDEMPISAPVVRQAIHEGNAVISGSFSSDAAKRLAIAINSGALPLPIKLVEHKNIGPTLGAVEVQKSLFAGAVGLALIMVFMIGYYGRLGAIASLTLIIYGLISLAIFRAIPVVLTLPGLAGFILSIGMAVDSNILIFERIKEERRNGRDFDIALRLGFNRAIHAIKDANLTTLLVTFILFNPLNWEFLPQFGLVRGFALTLAIGVVTSLFTGVVITRRLITIFYKKNT